MKTEQAAHICNYKLKLTFRTQQAVTVETAITCQVRNTCKCNWLKQKTAS